jgi:hypothetical protein
MRNILVVVTNIVVYRIFILEAPDRISAREPAILSY